MTSAQFYNHFLNSEIREKSKRQYYRGARVVVIDKGSVLYAELAKQGVIITNTARACLRCDRMFDGVLDMRICPACKKSLRNVDDCYTYYQGGKDF